MKKIFCDVCGDEFAYGKTPDLARVTAGVYDVDVQGCNGKLTFTVEVDISHRQEPGVSTHVDVCNDCQWHILDKLDNRPRVGN